MRLKRVMLIAAVMVMAGAFTGCGKKEEKPEQPKIEKEKEPEAEKTVGEVVECGKSHATIWNWAGRYYF